MLRTRCIPCLLLDGARLVKTVRFRQPTYVGDPINAVRIFNDKEVDEIAVLDITAHRRAEPQFELISQIASECFMPMCYGGGVRSIQQMQRLFQSGVEKVAVNTAAVADPALVTGAAERFGSQSIVVAVDVKKTWLGGYAVHTHGGRTRTQWDPVAYAREMEKRGAGEFFLNSMDRDGTGEGFDLELIRRVTQAVSIPVIACGGAGKIEDLAAAVKKGGASAVAAGSLFVFHGPHRAVLITYPERRTLEQQLD
jgi:cyclase